MACWAGVRPPAFRVAAMQWHPCGNVLSTDSRDSPQCEFLLNQWCDQCNSFIDGQELQHPANRFASLRFLLWGQHPQLWIYMWLKPLLWFSESVYWRLVRMSLGMLTFCNRKCKRNLLPVPATVICVYEGYQRYRRITMIFNEQIGTNEAELHNKTRHRMFWLEMAGDSHPEYERVWSCLNILSTKLINPKQKYACCGWSVQREISCLYAN